MFCLTILTYSVLPYPYYTTVKLHTGARHPIVIVQISPHDCGPVGQESSIYTEKSIVPEKAVLISSLESI